LIPRVCGGGGDGGATGFKSRDYYLKMYAKINLTKLIPLKPKFANGSPIL
jgi:hypothetical protein